MNDVYYMQIALEEAKKGYGTTDPNPMVGALIVEGEKIVAKGFHRKAGEAHAEIIAFENLGRKPASDAIMYVTLEPCCTFGRTGPCTDAIIKSGIKQVVIGTIDPNPKHQGRGIEILQNAGINVRVGILEKECSELNKKFNQKIRES